MKVKIYVELHSISRCCDRETETSFYFKLKDFTPALFLPVSQTSAFVDFMSYRSVGYDFLFSKDRDNEVNELF